MKSLKIPTTLVLFLITLLITMNSIKSLENTITSSSSHYTESEAKIFTKFSKLASCASKPLNEKCPKCVNPGNGYKFYFFYQTTRINKFNYKFMIHYNDILKKILVTFAGPSVNEHVYIKYIYSAGFSLVKKYNFQIEKEYYQIYFNKLRKILKQKLQKIRSSGRAKFQTYFAGHSIGGSLATLAAFDMQQSKVIKNIKVFSLAPLRLGDAAFVAMVNSYVTVYRIVKKSDYLVRIPNCYFSTTYKMWRCFNEKIVKEFILKPTFPLKVYVNSYLTYYRKTNPVLKVALLYARKRLSHKNAKVKKHLKKKSRRNNKHAKKNKKTKGKKALRKTKGHKSNRKSLKKAHKKHNKKHHKKHHNISKKLKHKAKKLKKKSYSIQKGLKNLNHKVKKSKKTMKKFNPKKMQKSAKKVNKQLKKLFKKKPGKSAMKKLKKMIKKANKLGKRKLKKKPSLLKKKMKKFFKHVKHVARKMFRKAKKLLFQGKKLAKKAHRRHKHKKHSHKKAKKHGKSHRKAHKKPGKIHKKNKKSSHKKAKKPKKSHKKAKKVKKAKGKKGKKLSPIKKLANKNKSKSIVEKTYTFIPSKFKVYTPIQTYFNFVYYTQPLGFQIFYNDAMTEYTTCQYVNGISLCEKVVALPLQFTVAGHMTYFGIEFEKCEA